MFKKVCLLMLLQLYIVSNVAFAEGITIVVAPEARVEVGTVTLGQLADISGDDLPWVESLRQLKVGNAPAPGSSMVLTKELLNIRLAASGSNFNGIVWEIPETVKITTDFQVVSGQSLIDKAIVTIEEQAGLRVSSGNLSIVPLGSVQDVIAPMGNILLTSYLPYGIRNNAPTTVGVTISVNGQVFTKINLKFDTKLYRQVAVATTQVSPGEIFTTDKLRYERMDSARLGLGYFTDMNKILGMAARRSLTPGMVVMDSMVNKPLLIKRGNMVNIVARIGNMAVTTAGQAMQDGSEGKLIRVQNINSTKILLAKVLDGSTVQVLTYNSNGH